MNQGMLADYTEEQIQMLDKLDDRVAEAKTFKYSGFKSPKLLYNILQKEKYSSPIDSPKANAHIMNNFVQNDLQCPKSIQLFRIEKLRAYQGFIIQ